MAKDKTKTQTLASKVIGRYKEIALAEREEVKTADTMKALDWLSSHYKLNSMYKQKWELDQVKLEQERLKLEKMRQDAEQDKGQAMTIEIVRKERGDGEGSGESPL